MQKDSDISSNSINTTHKIIYIVVSFIVNSLLFIAIFILFWSIVPGYPGMFESSGAELPVATRMLFQLSNFVVTYWFLYIVVSVISILLLSCLLAVFYIKEWFSIKKILVTHIALSAGIGLVCVILFYFVVYIPAMDIKNAVSMLV
jgi:hypothetical protein